MADNTDKPKIGRPTTYTVELADEICARITEGESLNRICQDDHIPALKVVYSWLRLHDEFSNNYVRARDEQADTYADKIQDIAEGALSKRYDPNSARVAIDGYKWSASKLKPKKYGDKLDVESGGKPITFIVNRGGDEQTDSND